VQYSNCIHPDKIKRLGDYCGQRRRTFLLGHASKIPYRGSNGVLAATDDFDVLMSGLAADPAANIAMAYGAGSRITCVDWDLRHGAEDTYAKLVRLYGDLDPTVRIHTANGWHDLYDYIPGIPSRANAGGLQGCDVRNDGAYGLVPWSVHPTGPRYTYDIDKDLREHQPGPMPAPLRNILLTGTAEPDSEINVLHRVTPSKAWVEMFSLPGETRHATISRFTGHLLRRGVDGHLTLAIAQMWNNHLARPEPLPEAEVRRIVENIARCELHRREADDE
jgi:hypothetical protein